MNGSDDDAPSTTQEEGCGVLTWRAAVRSGEFLETKKPAAMF